MSTKPMLTAVERYLGAQMECETAADNIAESAAKESRLENARKEMEKEAARAAVSGGQIRRILLAVDHEKHSALETALKIAQPLRAQVAIAFVLEPLPAPAVDMAYDLTPAYEETRAAAKAMLAKFEKEIPQHSLAFTVLREGQAAAEIVAAAKDFKADLIIMGTHRRGALARFFLGSVSQAVLRKATCPVMFVADAPVTAEQPQVLQNA